MSDFILHFIILAVGFIRAKAYVSGDELASFDLNSRTKFKDDTFYRGDPFPSSFRFLRTTYNKVYINGNGLITLGQSHKANRYGCNPGSYSVPTIAAYLANTQQSSQPVNGSFAYKTITVNSNQTSPVFDDIATAFPDYDGNITDMLYVVWDGTPAYNGHELTNIFQAILAYNDDDTFLLLYYYNITWPNVNVRDRSLPEIGIFGGSSRPDNTFVIPGSCKRLLTNVAGMTNFGRPGKFVFKVDTSIKHPDVVICIPKNDAPQTVEFSPRVVPALGSIPVLVRGLQICLEAKIAQVLCTFYDVDEKVSLDGQVIPGNLAVICPTPSSFNSTGKTRIDLDITFESNPNLRMKEVSISGYVVVTPYLPTEMSKYNISLGIDTFTASWNEATTRPKEINQFYETVTGRPLPIPSEVDISIVELQEHTWNEIFTLTDVPNTGHLSISRPANITSLLKTMSESSSRALGFKVSAVIKSNDGLVLTTESVYDISGTTIQFAGLKSQEIHERSCEDWFNNEENVQNDSLPCPSSMKQILYDWRFRPFDRNSKVTLFIQSPPSRSGSSSVCSYQNYSDDLVTGTNYGSCAIKYSPAGKNSPWSYFKNDYIPKLDCCMFSSSAHETCEHKFQKKRPISHGYSFPTLFKITGAGNVITMDGVSYIMNAVGAFWLVRNDHTSILVLSVPYSNVMPSASVITTVVLTGRSHSRFEIVAVPEGLQVWIDNQALNFYKTELEQVYEYIDNYLTISESSVTVYLNGTNSVLFSFSNGLSVKFSPTAEGRSLNILGSMGPELKGKVKGLLGNYDGSADSDLDLSNVQALPLAEIYSQFLQHWKLTEVEFRFPIKTSFQYSKNNYFKAYELSYDEILATSETSEANHFCSNNECIVDFALTGDAEFARSSTSEHSEYEEMSRFASKVRISSESADSYSILRIFLAAIGAFCVFCLMLAFLYRDKLCRERCYSGGNIYEDVVHYKPH